MQHVSTAKPVPQAHAAQQGHTGPLIIITILFFMWGLLTSMNEVLIPHLKSVYELSYLKAMLVQLCFFGAYFIVSLPAGILIKKIGYQKGAVAGLVIAAIGCAMFYPAANAGYALFLLSLFVLASGITVLQVAANPYVTVLGDPATASSRLTLTQAFNSLGATVAPYLGALLILSSAVLSVDELKKLPAAEQLAYRAQEAATVQVPYLVMAAVLLALATFFALARLPAIADSEAGDDVAHTDDKTSAAGYRHLVLGALGIFLYVGAEVSIGSFLINFMGEKHIAGFSADTAAKYVTIYGGGAMLGRFIGFAAMRYVSPGRALAFNAACSIALIMVAVFGSGMTAMWAILLVGLCNSIMFPTIFSMALFKLGKFTGQGSSILCMAIVGGALVPLAQSVLADAFGVQLSFLVPAACYLFVIYYGLKYARMYQG
ncbi:MULTISPECIES: L-fucose:H+ symporter permease [Massilia]|uniref:L-fucose:H+ symporter permease n=2 Tax=Massilia TaxID=149698 RepID=A0ABY4ADE5_9BURK|nr:MULTISPECIES: L-fucose:H+ symporter permease [Massilia]NHZ40216.1 L-fucose:H+ symporter permease [Massilia aquatica]UOD32822.1 L-fucose:H+ symporter permease [Massilia violaceinigra]